MPSGVYKHKPLSEETKIKIGNKNRGKKASLETRKKLREAHLGYIMPDEQKLKISESNKGRKLSPETIARMSGANKYNWKGGVSKIKKYRNWQKNKRNRLKYAIAKKLGGHTFGEWELLKKQYNYTCPCCKLSEPFNQKSKYLTEDHIIPLSKGGSDLIENIQPLCLSCNIKKNSKVIQYLYEIRR